MKVGNQTYDRPDSAPEIVPVFPLPAALLLPRAELPLNIFEPRYIEMVDHALCTDRVIAMIQPGEKDSPHEDSGSLCGVGCMGRVTSFAETGDGRYLITLTGISRFRVVEEMEVRSTFRMCRVSASDFAEDFATADEDSVDRATVLKTFRDYLEANSLDADWESIDRASNEILVNALAMMAPFGPAEKQALLEAPDLKRRAETLVALTEVTLARESNTGHSLQ